jgi:outer membrane biogenesis lipoprotein LolB
MKDMQRPPVVVFLCLLLTACSPEPKKEAAVPEKKAAIANPNGGIISAGRYQFRVCV